MVSACFGGVVAGIESKDVTDLGSRCDTEFRWRRYLSWKRVGMGRRWSINHARAQEAPVFLVGKQRITWALDFLKPDTSWRGISEERRIEKP